jgi:hypothetical protein
MSCRNVRRSQKFRQTGSKTDQPVWKYSEVKGQNAMTPCGGELSNASASSRGCVHQQTNTASQMRARVGATGHRRQAARQAMSAPTPTL